MVTSGFWQVVREFSTGSHRLLVFFSAGSFKLPVIFGRLSVQVISGRLINSGSQKDISGFYRFLQVTSGRLSVLVPLVAYWQCMVLSRLSSADGY